MVTPLQEILEKQFRMQYWLHLSIQDYSETELKELNWLYARLIKQLNDENAPKSKEGQRS